MDPRTQYANEIQEALQYWAMESGLYSIRSLDTNEILDQEEREGMDDLVHCWPTPPNHPVTNPNQLWYLSRIKDGQWLLINKRAGTYLAAPDAGCSVVPQTGHPDWSNAHWKIVPTSSHSVSKVVITSVNHPGMCLEVVDTIVKIGERRMDAPGQIWCLKYHT